MPARAIAQPLCNVKNEAGEHSPAARTRAPAPGEHGWRGGGLRLRRTVGVGRPAVVLEPAAAEICPAVFGHLVDARQQIARLATGDEVGNVVDAREVARRGKVRQAPRRARPCKVHRAVGVRLPRRPGLARVLAAVCRRRRAGLLLTRAQREHLALLLREERLEVDRRRHPAPRGARGRRRGHGRCRCERGREQRPGHEARARAVQTQVVLPAAASLRRELPGPRPAHPRPRASPADVAGRCGRR